MAKFKDLTNIKFGKLTALFPVKFTDTGQQRWRWSCTCECGNTSVVYTSNLTTGKTKSCGCSQNNTGIDHGMYKHGYSIGINKVYKAWNKIKERCYNTNDASYPLYGELGILMDTEFVEDFESFLKEVGDYPTDGIKYSIDRIDNDLGYTKGNMRWATVEQQARNKGKFKNNTSGFTGVSFTTSGKRFVVIAVWLELNGERKQKYFSIKKLGLLPAFARACEYRLSAIERLNLQGAGYTDKHGK